MECKIKGNVEETNYSDNTCIRTHRVQIFKEHVPPDTIFENRPSGFIRPTGLEQTPTSKFADNVMTSVNYERWEWSNDFVKRRYDMSLSANYTLQPDSKSPSRYLQNGTWVMRSGYGVELNVQANINANLPDNAYTNVQNGNAYLPEFRFTADSNKYRTMEVTSTNVLNFPQNENTIINTGQQDYKRIHFSPLWYPDGEYEVKTYIYDVWSPVGMLSITEDINQVTIDGNMYDDWYLGHGGKTTPREPLKVPIKLDIITPPTKVGYIEGEVFDKAGMVVQVTYDNGDTAIVSSYSTPRQRLEFEQNFVVISYTEDGKVVTANQEVTVKPKTPISLEVIALPNKLVYIEEENLDLSGLILKVTFDNGSIEIIDNYLDTSKVVYGQNKVDISYSYNKTKLSTYFGITVIKKTAVSMRLEKLPDKTHYIEETNFDPTGMIIKLTYNNGTEGIFEYKETPKVFYNQTAVRIVYDTGDVILDLYVPITVEKKKPIALRLDRLPNKTTYYEETNFDPTGMILKIVFNNDTEEVYDYKETPKVVYNQTEVLIRYKSDTIDLSVIVPIIVEEDPMAKWFNFNDNTGAIIKFKGDLAGAPTEVPIPKIIRGKTVTSLGYGAFRGFTKITKVLIPETVESIGEYAFHYCTSLSSVNIPSKVTELNVAVFRECGSLKDIVLPEGLKTIRTNAFRSTGLTKIIIPNTVTTLEMWSFAFCTSATELQLSTSIKEIGGSAFEGLSIKSLYIPEGVEVVGPGAFNQCKSLRTIYIPNSMVEMVLITQQSILTK